MTRRREAHERVEKPRRPGARGVFARRAASASIHGHRRAHAPGVPRRVHLGAQHRAVGDVEAL